MTEKIPDLAKLRDVLAFDPNTGFFTWKKPQSNSVRVGQRAGNVGANGRRYVEVLGGRYAAHHLALYYVLGVWPSAYVRHMNGDYDDCRLSNLAEETVQANIQRQKIRTTNESGIKGVSWDASRGKWTASMYKDYKRISLGRFDTKDAAAEAYLEAMRAGVSTEVETLDATSVPDEKERFAKAAQDRRRLLVLWRDVTARYKRTGWDNKETMLAEIGWPPNGRYRLFERDDSLAIGPGNFEWRSVDDSLPFQRHDKESAPRKRERRAEMRLVEWNNDLKKKYGIDSTEYEKMLSAQGGVCAICKCGETTIRNGRQVALAVDHCHNTNRVRRLLCSGCNKGLGNFRDNPAYLRAAIDYLTYDEDVATVVPLRAAEANQKDPPI